MRTKILLDLDKKVFVIAMRPHWWSKWIIDYSFSTNALYEALERKRLLHKVSGTIRIFKDTNKE